MQVTYSSDYFPQLFDLAVELIKRGRAYVDHQVYHCCVSIPCGILLIFRSISLYFLVTQPGGVYAVFGFPSLLLVSGVPAYLNWLLTYIDKLADSRRNQTVSLRKERQSVEEQAY